MSSGKVPVAQIKRFEALYRLPENRECFDCTAKQPRWGSTNLGIFFCLRCAGVHRSLGVHITKVKSSTMDTWDEEMIQRMEKIGNGNGKLLYEARLPPSFRKPDAGCDSSEVERIARQKYEQRLWVAQNFDDVMIQLLSATTQTAPVLSPVAPPAGTLSGSSFAPVQATTGGTPRGAPQNSPAAVSAANPAENWSAFVSSPTTLPPAAAAAKIPPQQPDFWSLLETPPAKPTLTCEDLFGAPSASQQTQKAVPVPFRDPKPLCSSTPANHLHDSLFGEFKSSPTVPSGAPGCTGTTDTTDHLFDFGPPSGKPTVDTQEILALFSNSNRTQPQQRIGVPPVRY